MTSLRLKHWHRGRAHSQPYVCDPDGHKRQPYPEDDADRLHRTNRYPYDPETDFVFVGRTSHGDRTWCKEMIRPPHMTPAQHGWRKMLQVLYPALREDEETPEDEAEPADVAG